MPQQARQREKRGSGAAASIFNWRRAAVSGLFFLGTICARRAKRAANRLEGRDHHEEMLGSKLGIGSRHRVGANCRG
jgi:hypothetical protein